MSIYNDIKKVTQIPFTDESPNLLFVRNGFKRNPKPQKPPETANLYTYNDDNTDNNKQQYNDSPQELHESEIEFQVKEANCGVNYSNEVLEKNWKTRQLKSKSNHFIGFSSKTNETNDIEDEEYVLRKCRLDKNAAIRGLLRNHIISVCDLQIPNKSGEVEEKKFKETCVQNENISSLNNLTEEYSMKLVPYPEDSEVFVQPIHAYGKLNENEYKDIDFTVPRVGKKYVVTPRQFYVNTDDSEFDFVKKDIKKRK